MFHTMSLRLPRSWEFNLKPDFGKIARSVSMMSSEFSASLGRLQSQNSLEKPVQCGWLKKQRSIVKNWQQRYFVLKGQQLWYYKDEDDSKPQGCIFLPSSTVSEVACNPEDVGKFIFEIIPGSPGEQNRTSPDSYVLMANTQAEMEKWVKAIKRAAGSPSGVVFGQRLVDTIAYEKKYGRHPVPILIEKCADFILENGLREEGIFRLPAQDNLVKQLREAFDAGERPSFGRDTDVHTVASLFKLYLRELPEPVIPWSQYEDCLTCETTINADEEKGHQELIKQISLVPAENYNLLSFICRFLHEVQKHSSVNKMSVDNLAMVIGVNLIRPKAEDPVVIMKGAPQIQKLMTVMISHHEKFFPKTNDLSQDHVPQNKEYKKAPIPRSSVGWDSAEDSVSSGGDLLKGQTRDTSDSRSSSTSDDGLTPLEDSDSSTKDKLGSWIAVPRKRTQTLPTTHFSAAVKEGESDNSSLRGEIFSSEFWASPRGRQSFLTSFASGHKRTLSEEFRQRKSTYDNVPSTQGDNDNWSCTRPNDLPAKSGDKESTAQQTTNYVKHGVPSPEAESKDAIRCDTSSNMLELKQEMETQKNILEERIKSLEKENFEVWTKVVRLNEDLEKERNTRAALEMKLQNIECSRDDAEKRNKHLEKEIQGFVRAMSETGNKVK